MAKKKTHEEFVSELKLKNKNFDNIELLSEYCGIKNRIKCKCKVCDYEWEPISDSLMRGRGCPICAQKRRDKSKYKFISDYSELLNNMNLSVVSDYINATTPATFKCNVYSKVQ